MGDVGQGKFGGQFPDFFGDLFKMLNTGAPIQWELAVQLAESVANSTQDKINTQVDQVDRIHLEELYSIAELHVSDITGMNIGNSGKTVAISVVNRSQWIRSNISSWKPLLESIAQTIIDSNSAADPDDSPSENKRQIDNKFQGSKQDSPDLPDSKIKDDKSNYGEELDLEKLGLSDLANMPFDINMLHQDNDNKLSAENQWGDSSSEAEPGAEWPSMLSQWTKFMAPTMLAMQFGSVIGRLAKYSLGGYDFPLPRNSYKEIIITPQNIKQFSSDWGIDLPECEIYTAASDIACHAILGRDHVSAYLTNLLVSYSQYVNPDPATIEEKIKGLSQFNISDMTQIMTDPALFGELTDSTQLQQIKREIDTFTSVLLGYIDWVADAVSTRLLANNQAIKEALKRRRVERNFDERAAETFFGLSLTQEALEKGTAFINGVLARDGENELAALWTKKEFLPTKSELEAPGLWLERIRLNIEI